MTIKFWPKSVWRLLGLTLGFVFAVSPVAQAASVSFSKLTGKECVAANSVVTLQWSATDVDHVALYYRTDGQTPNYQTDPVGLITGTHSLSANGSYTWTTPNNGTQTGKLWVEGHSASHQVVAISGSAIGIDDSSPSAPILSVGTTSPTTVSLVWSEAVNAGCQGTLRYDIYRDGVNIASVANSATTYSDQTVTANSTYSYYVHAYDDLAATNPTTGVGKSNTVQATAKTQPTASPTATSTISPTPIGAVTATASPKVTASPKATATPTPRAKKTTPSPEPPTPYPTPAIDALRVEGESVPETARRSLVLAQNQEVIISGRAAAGSTIILTIHSQSQDYPITADDGGQWTFALPVNQLDVGKHTVTLLDKSKNSAPKNILEFTLVAPEQLAVIPYRHAAARQALLVVVMAISVTLLVSSCLGTDWRRYWRLTNTEAT